MAELEEKIRAMCDRAKTMEDEFELDEFEVVEKEDEFDISLMQNDE